ncbi:hypothetical protein AN216_20695 [Streptomyces oceani]|uniref:FAD-binding PCMH-type domain-containing protein n=1 Tax=Streptomyces oceani TaxID=1075402 RepID=A0A1E7JXQ0_9ACTN|nr:hypothetical protein AN216_20695 [Streptomyces oceani]
MAGYQLGLTLRPDVVVGALDAADVRAAVRYAAARSLPVRVQATGHGTPGPCGGGVLVSTRRMNDVHVDPEARTARVGAGARWEQLIEAATPHGLAPLNGSAPHSGVIGYTLGGGVGLLARTFGYTADHVRSLDVVTADGESRHVTAADEPDLFWALRGGRDGLGVVTGMEIDLVPVARIYGGSLMFDAGRAKEVLTVYRDWTAGLTERLTSSVMAIVLPDVPALPEPLRGRHVLGVRIAFTGSAAEGERLVAPLRELGPLTDQLADMPYERSPAIHSDPTEPHAYTGSNVLLRELDVPSVLEYVERGGPAAEFFTVVQLQHLGGALARPPRGGNAVGHRDAAYALSVLSVAEEEREGEARAFHRELEGPLARWTVGRFVNFQFGVTEESERRDRHEPAIRRRLADVRAAYDPDGRFPS